MKKIDYTKAPVMEIGQDNRCEIKSVKPENVFTFDNGILGFEQETEFVFLLNEKIKPFMFMQSLNNANLSFVCIKTDLICPNHSMTLSKKPLKELELARPQDALVLSLVTVSNDVSETTANIMSPIIINIRRSKGIQFIPEQSDYPVRLKIWDAIENNETSALNVG